MSDIHWDSELIRCYLSAAQPVAGRPQHWHTRIGSFELLHALRNSRQQLRPLHLHLHLPFCSNSCRHCQRVSLHGYEPQQLQDYLSLLQLEIERLSCHLDPRQRVRQLSFSGGSPTQLGTAGLQQLMASLRGHFNLSDSSMRDFCIELDPRQADWSSMGQLLELGFNRVALRVDDLDSTVQTAIGRPLSLASIRTLVEAAHTLQFRSVSIELTRGLPGQTPASFERSLQRVIELQPDRLSLPEYQPLPAQPPIDNAPLPDAAARLEILARSVEQVQQAGYQHIGLDLFALPDDDLAAAQEEGLLHLNLYGLALRDCDVLGLGASACSQIGTLRCQNHQDLEDYRRSLKNDQLPTWRGELCDAEECLQQTLRQQLVCTRSLCFSELERCFGLDIRQHFGAIWPTLEKMASEGLLELGREGLRLTPGGALFTDELCRLLRSNPTAEPAKRQAGALH